MVANLNLTIYGCCYYVCVFLSIFSKWKVRWLLIGGKFFVRVWYLGVEMYVYVGKFIGFWLLLFKQDLFKKIVERRGELILFKINLLMVK